MIGTITAEDISYDVNAVPALETAKVQRSGYEADHSPPSTADVEGEQCIHLRLL